MLKQGSPNKVFRGQHGLERCSEIERVAEQCGHGFSIQAREPIAERELSGSVKTARVHVQNILVDKHL